MPRPPSSLPTESRIGTKAYAGILLLFFLLLLLSYREVKEGHEGGQSHATAGAEASLQQTTIARSGTRISTQPLPAEAEGHRSSVVGTGESANSSSEFYLPDPLAASPGAPVIRADEAIEARQTGQQYLSHFTTASAAGESAPGTFMRLHGQHISIEGAEPVEKSAFPRLTVVLEEIPGEEAPIPAENSPVLAASDMPVSPEIAGAEKPHAGPEIFAPTPAGFSTEEALFRMRWGWQAYAAASRAAFEVPKSTVAP